MQQRHQVLGRFHPADPDQRVRVGALRGLADLGEAGRVHTRVDGADLVAVRAAVLLPAAGVRIAGRDAGCLPVDLGGQPALEGGKQGPHRGRGLRGREVVRAQPHAVLGHQQRYAREVPGEQSGQRGRASRRGMTQVDRAEAVVLVPVEREGAQGSFQVRGHGEQIRYASLARRTQRTGRPTCALQGTYGGFGAECADETALVAGEFGEPVQRAAETVRLSGRLLRGGRRAQCCHEVAVVLGEPPARAARIHDPVVLGRPQRRRPHPADLRRQVDPALVLLAFAAAERVDVELVLPEPAHEPVAPESGVTAHIWIATLRKQSDAHECTPDLPSGEPPLARRLAAGRTYADMTVARRTVVRRATERGEPS